jgi:hypothetical protein
MPSIVNPQSDYPAARAASPAPPGPDQRDSNRSSVSTTVSFRQPGRKGNVVTLRDVSATGCRFTSYVRPAIGQRIWVSLPGLESLGATVRWIAGNDCGCEFDRGIHPAVLDSLLQRLVRRPS